jgi:hypothetical protein
MRMQSSVDLGPDVEDGVEARGGSAVAAPAVDGRVLAIEPGVVAVEDVGVVSSGSMP